MMPSLALKAFWWAAGIIAATVAYLFARRAGRADGANVEHARQLDAQNKARIGIAEADRAAAGQRSELDKAIEEHAAELRGRPPTEGDIEAAIRRHNGSTP